MQNLNRQDYLNLPGIYKFYTADCKKVYIGSTKCLYKRINSHINSLKNNVHSAKYLQNYINKYGLDSIKLEILKVYDSGVDRNFLFQEEQFYLNKYLNDDFILFNSHIDVFFFKNNFEIKAKCKQRIKQSWKDNYEHNKNAALKNLEKAHIGCRIRFEKIRSGEIVYNSPLKGKKVSDATKDKQSISAKKRGRNCNKVVYQYCMNGKFIKKWESPIDFLRENNLPCTNSNISRCAIKKNCVCHDFLWRYYKKEQLILEYSIINLENNTELFFQNRCLVARYLNTSVEIIRNRVKTGKPFNNKYIIKINDNTEHFSYARSKNR